MCATIDGKTKTNSCECGGAQRGWHDCHGDYIKSEKACKVPIRQHAAEREKKKLSTMPYVYAKY